MFGTVLIPNIHQKGLMEVGSIVCLVLRNNIHSLVPVSKQSKLPNMIEDICRDKQHARRWSHSSMVFWQLLSSELLSEEQVIFPWSVLLGQSSHYAVEVIEHVVVHSDNVMQCDCMPSWHPQGPISKWPQYFHDIVHNGPLNLSWEKWLVISGFSIVEPLACQFP